MSQKETQDADIRAEVDCASPRAKNLANGPASLAAAKSQSPIARATSIFVGQSALISAIAGSEVENICDGLEERTIALPEIEKTGASFSMRSSYEVSPCGNVSSYSDAQRRSHALTERRHVSLEGLPAVSNAHAVRVQVANFSDRHMSKPALVEQALPAGVPPRPRKAQCDFRRCGPRSALRIVPETTVSTRADRSLRPAGANGCNCR